MESMNLERISLVMDKFESQFADLDVQTSYMEDTMQSTTAVSTPQDQIDELMKQAAEEVRSRFPPSCPARAALGQCILTSHISLFEPRSRQTSNFNTT